jgi:dolichyl-phosphate beta-glucosyltransferase
MLLSMQKIAIIIPCYNEEKRLQENSLLHLLEHSAVDLFFANDGSTDGTLAVIEKFSVENFERSFILDYTQNQGKAHTIHKAVNHIIDKNSYDFIGYFDADFSTPVTELLRMLNAVNENNHSFLFGSRVLLLNTKIQRKWYRHIIGRIVVTIINLKFKLGIYDTQCGAKIFSNSVAKVAFRNVFYTSWLFDVEVFLRLKKENLLDNGLEFPLKEWKDIEGSKLGFHSAFKILKELFQLIRKYD